MRCHVGAGWRKRAALVVVVATAAEQVAEEVAGARPGGGVLGVLRSATILSECGQHRTPLIVPISAHAAAAQPLEIDRDLIQIAAHLLDLVVDRTALRGAGGKQREESRAVAAHVPRLRGELIKLGLLLCRRLLIAADLLLSGGIVGAALDARELSLKARTDRIDGWRRRALRHRLRRQIRIHLLREGGSTQREAAEQRCASKEPAGHGSGIEIRHLRQSKEVRSLRAAAASHSRFFRRGHAVSAAAAGHRAQSACVLQRWQVMATYALQRPRVHFRDAFGTEPVISSGSTLR